MSPLIPRSRDLKHLNRKRKTEQKKCIIKKKPNINLFEKKKLQKTVINPKKTKNNKKHIVTVYMLFPDEMQSDLPICCCFRLIYIISDRKIECFGGGLGTLPRVLFEY